MRSPRDLVSTMWSNSALQLISSGDNFINSFVRSIGVSHVPVLGSVVSWMAGMVRTAWNNIVSLLAPGANASNDYYASAPEAINNIGNAAASSLSAHSGWIHWGIQQYVPDYVNNVYNQIYNWINRLTNTVYQLYDDSLNFTIAERDASDAYTSNVYNTLYSMIIRYFNSTNAFITDVANSLNQYIAQVYQVLLADLLNVQNYLVSYANDLHSDAVSRINAAVIALEAQLAAAVTFLTVTVIPGAIEANNLAMNAATAAAVAVFWEDVATTNNANLAQLTLIDPTGIWEIDGLPEIPPIVIPEAIAESVDALRLPMDFLAKAGIPLYRNLKQFGQDTNDLDGVVTTVLLGGLLVAAVTAPEDTATLIATTIAGPLNAVATSLVDLLGSL